MMSFQIYPFHALITIDQKVLVSEVLHSFIATRSFPISICCQKHIVFLDLACFVAQMLQDFFFGYFDEYKTGLHENGSILCWHKIVGNRNHIK